MKLFIVLAFLVAIAYALPAEEVGQNKKVEKSSLTIADLEVDSADEKNINVQRIKRQPG